jgi:malonyl-CoA/methylmalonyl-CoA synthetase
MANHLFDGLSRAGARGATFIETPSGRRWTYGDMMEQSARLAGVLRALDVKPGDRVLVQVEKSAEAIALYLGTVRAGAIFLPLNTAYTLSEVEYFVGDAEPKLIVCDPARAEPVGLLAARYGAEIETLDEHGGGSLAELAAAQPSLFADVERGPDDLAAILYTSGTTGRSKGAMLSHDNLTSNALALAALWRFGPDDVLIHALPIFHTHGLFVATNVSLLTAGTMLFLPKFDADEILRLMPQATAMMGVPTFYVRLVEHAGLTREATKHMRLFVSGSAPLLAETHRKFEALTGHAILERYGMTETNMNTSNPYDGDRIPAPSGSRCRGWNCASSIRKPARRSPRARSA